MKVAVLTDCVSRNAGGMFHSVRRLAQELRYVGVDVDVFGIRDDKTGEDLHEWLPLQPDVLPCRGPQSFGYAPQLMSTLKAQRPDVIQTHGLWKYMSWASLRASTCLKCPHIIHPHGMLDPWAVRNSRWKKVVAGWTYERRHLTRAACIRALNDSEAAAIRAYGLRNAICVIPNAIDLPDTTSPCSNGQDSESVTTASGNGNVYPFPGERKTLLYLGRIHPKKGLENLVHAWKLACPSNGAARSADWNLAIAGWDQFGHEALLRRQADELELNGSIHFLGPRFSEAKAACFRDCDAFVLPSFSEGLPMTVLEAWSYGKPVLMTSQCNLPDGFSTSSALLIEPEPLSIAAGLKTLFDMTSEERESMGRRGFELVSQRYTWPQVARQMHQVYDWVLGGGSIPACVYDG